ncbi:MAG: hypothetical protein HGB05_02890 [Chloroflexi bacterium]|jgi:hypothetical protein|nr:hypothetical protein [Chloroflexota bacterium]
MTVLLPASLEQEIHEAAAQQGIEADAFVEAAVQRALQEYRERQIAAESRAWYALSADVRQRYAGVYVAVRHGQVIDTDPDQRALYLRVRQALGRAPIMITIGGDHPMPVYTIRSPRLVRLHDGE